MANTKVTGDLIASSTIATGNIADNAVTSDKISGITTAHITEGSNLYYTDARADARAALLVDSAPSTLNTLNELAAALGDDPNFATTVTNSIATKMPIAGGTFTGNIAGVGASLIGTAASGAALVTIENNSGSTATSYGLLVIGGGNSSNGRTFEVRDASGNTDLIVKGNSNVGIGTASPNVLLQLRSNVNTIPANTDFALQSGKYIRFLGASDGNADYGSYLYAPSNGIITLGTRWTSTDEGGLTVNRGDVGIGTTSPGRKLTVTGDASGDANNLLLANENDTDGDSTSIGFSMLSNNTYVKSGIFFKRTTTQGRGDLIFANNNEVNGNNVTLSDAKITIQPGGNVGIGADSPGSKLEIAAANSQVRLTDTDDSKFVLYSYSGGKLIVRNNSVNTTKNQFTLTEDGKFGIGTISPQENLEIHDAAMSTISLSYAGGANNGSSIDFNLRTPSPIASPLTSQIKAIDDGAYRQNISFSTKTSATASSGQTNRMMIKAGGYVGIGNTSGVGTRTKLGVSFNVGGSAANLAESVTYATMEMYPYRTGSTYGMFFGNKGTAAGYIQTANGAGNDKGDIHINPFGGSVGIGVGNTSAGALLDVVAPNSGGAARQDMFRLLQSGQNTLSCYMYGGTTDLVQLHVSGAEQHLSLTTGGVAIATTATGIHLRSGGDVGIGTLSPSCKLDVAGEITHEGLVPKDLSAGDVAFIDGKVTINKTVSTTANVWTSLDISLSNIGGTGTFVVQVYSNAHGGGTGAAWYNMYWSGIMSWYHSSTNDNDIEEIPLHMAGHARNNGTLELRTKLHTADGTSYANRCELQIKTLNTLSSAPISFRFRKLL